MKVQHSNSLLAVWRLAEMEANRLGAMELEPAHLLIGLTKAVDVDWIEAIDKETPDREELVEELLREIRKLRALLEHAGLNPTKTRRGLRQALANGRGKDTDGRLHRGEAARKVFAEAEKLAALEGTTVYPRHLLQGIRGGARKQIKDLLETAGIEGTALERLAKLPSPAEKGSRNRIAWN
jgi:ATP-dependent Clp protease ATP-binding subunit ClpA